MDKVADALRCNIVANYPQAPAQPHAWYFGQGALMYVGARMHIGHQHVASPLRRKAPIDAKTSRPAQQCWHLAGMPSAAANIALPQHCARIYFQDMHVTFFD